MSVSSHGETGNSVGSSTNNQITLGINNRLADEA
jgi:hypothetical protein